MVTGLDVFDRTVHKTNEMLRDVMAALHTDDRHQAYSALRATLHALRDRLPVDEAAHLGSQLPMLVRGIYYEGWHPAGKPLKVRDRDAFLQMVEGELPPDMGRQGAFMAVQAVFSALDQHAEAGEVAQVRQSLPAVLRELWPERT